MSDGSGSDRSAEEADEPREPRSADRVDSEPADPAPAGPEPAAPESAEPDPSDPDASDPESAEPDPSDPDASDPDSADRGSGIAVPSTVDRRTLLSVTGVALAGFGGALLGPSPPDRPDGPGDGDGVETDVPYAGAVITDREESPIVRYQHRRAGDGYDPTAPINVVFPLAETDRELADVTDVLRAAGWTDHVEEYARYAWDRVDERYEIQHATLAESSHGHHGRHHVRCWAFEGVVSMQAHLDTPARPVHLIESYAAGREAVIAVFAAAGWRVANDPVRLENDEMPDHDGTAAMLVPGDDQ